MHYLYQQTTEKIIALYILTDTFLGVTMLLNIKILEVSKTAKLHKNSRLKFNTKI